MAHVQDDVLKRPETFNFAIDVIDFWAAKSPPQRAMQWVAQDGIQTKSFSFRHFSRQSHRIAILLDRLGVRPGEVMLIVLPRVPAWWEIAVAALRSGIILSPGPTLVTDKDIQYRCLKSNASVFVGDAASVRKFQAVQSQCRSVRTVIQIDGSPDDGNVSLYSALEEIDADSTYTARRWPWKTPALLYFTSGTSGHPKMVVHNQISFPLALTLTGKHWLKLAPGKLYWNTSEQGWAKAAWSFLGAWNCGASLFVHDDRKPFDPIQMINILHRFPITTLCAPPLAWRQLVLRNGQDHYKRYPSEHLSHCTSAGEALNDEVIKQWRTLTGLDIHDGYGQTETILLCGNFEGNPIRPGSMGKPAPTVPLSVIDAKGARAETGEEGDIAVLMGELSGTGDFFGVFDGYLNDDGSIDRREKRYTTDDGQTQTWYLTGDKAKVDVDGYFWFVGRSDDVINSSGYRIGPFEVESALKQHSAVAESAVISSPDPTRGEVVKAFVVLTPDHASADQDSLRKELQDFCKKVAAPYKYPRKIEFVSASFLPKTVSGKIQRNELRKLEWGISQNGKPKL